MDAQEMRAGLIEALERSGEGKTIQDVEVALLTGKAQLWEGKRAAAVTQIVKTDREKVIHVWLGCGDLRELLEMQPGMAAFGRTHLCDAATIDGRAGWQRQLRRIGFKPDGDGELRMPL